MGSNGKNDGQLGLSALTGSLYPRKFIGFSINLKNTLWQKCGGHVRHNLLLATPLST